MKNGVVICIVLLLCSSCASNTPAPAPLTPAKLPTVGCYYTNPQVAAKSDMYFKEAMRLQSLAPSLSKGNTFSDVVAWTKTDQFKEKERLLRQATELGNPTAYLLHCIARSDPLGPPRLHRQGYGWCLAGLDIVGEMNMDIRRKLNEQLKDLETRLSGEELAYGKDFADKQKARAACK